MHRRRTLSFHPVQQNALPSPLPQVCLACSNRASLSSVLLSVCDFISVASRVGTLNLSPQQNACWVGSSTDFWSVWCSSYLSEHVSRSLARLAGKAALEEQLRTKLLPACAWFLNTRSTSLNPPPDMIDAVAPDSTSISCGSM